MSQFRVKTAFINDQGEYPRTQIVFHHWTPLARTVNSKDYWPVSLDLNSEMCLIPLVSRIVKPPAMSIIFSRTFTSSHLLILINLLSIISLLSHTKPNHVKMESHDLKFLNQSPSSTELWSQTLHPRTPPKTLQRVKKSARTPILPGEWVCLCDRGWFPHVILSVLIYIRRFKATPFPKLADFFKGVWFTFVG
jgi:hypothetical protein